MSHIAISMPALGVQEGLEKPKIALRVPSSSPMMLGTGYDSTAMHFTYSSPFKSLRDVAYYDQHEPRRQASYIQATSNRSSSVHEHVDLAFQGEIGNALAGGSARGNYMKRVAQDRSVGAFSLLCVQGTDRSRARDCQRVYLLAREASASAPHLSFAQRRLSYWSGNPMSSADDLATTLSVA